jgi:Carboxypeptidase regulatory-like domain
MRPKDGPTRRELVGSVAVAASSYSFSQQRIQEGSAEAPEVQISGKLSDPRQAPIPGATIGIARWDHTRWQPLVQSSAAGTFQFRARLQPGDYAVIAAFGAYTITTQYLKIPRVGTRTFTVALEASFFTAKSDLPPASTPPVGLLPRGRFETGLGGPGPLLGPGGPGPGRGPGKMPSVRLTEFVNVYYVTNRLPFGQAGYFADSVSLQPPLVSYGICAVRIPPTHRPGQLERPSIWRLERQEDPDRHIVISRREPVDPQARFLQPEPPGKLNPGELRYWVVPAE